MKILVGLGDSGFSTAILNCLQTQFRPERCEVKVIHILQPLSMAAMPEMSSRYAPELEDRKGPARDMVNQFAAELRASGFRAEAAVEMGDVRDRMLATAAEWDADLIMVGSHGQNAISRLLVGSVADSIVRHAPCSVQVVRLPRPA